MKLILSQTHFVLIEVTPDKQPTLRVLHVIGILLRILIVIPLNITVLPVKWEHQIPSFNVSILTCYGQTRI